ncbi:MAG: helix-turn-helix domain-containing protein [Solirubrobacteraceae bacterium]
MPEDEYLTPAQVAEELQVTDVTVRRWIAGGELRARKAGPRRWMIRRSDIEQFMAAGAGATGAAVEISEDPGFDTHLIGPDDR